MPAAGTMAVITVDVAGDRAADAVDAPVADAADRDAREKQGLGVRDQGLGTGVDNRSDLVTLHPEASNIRSP